MRILTATAAFLTLSAACFGQSQEPAKKINKVPVEYTNPASGAEMFKSYCAGPVGQQEGRRPANGFHQGAGGSHAVDKKEPWKVPGPQDHKHHRGKSLDRSPRVARHADVGRRFPVCERGYRRGRYPDRNIRDYIESLQQK